MRRRKLLRLAGTTAIAAAASTWVSGRGPVRAQSGSVTVRWLGHTCFLFVGGGLRILVNPFRQIGCTAGYAVPAVDADLVLISSQLLDEGDVGQVPGNPQVLFEPGAYTFRGLELQGIGIAHDREGGRRFGTNVAWMWEQGGLKLLHLGGAAAPIEIEQKILIGRPDVVFLPVGNGIKAYTPSEAIAALETLRPRLAVPTHYRTQAADEANCDLLALDEFLELVDEVSIRRAGSNELTLSPASLPADGTVIQIMGNPPFVPIANPTPTEADLPEKSDSAGEQATRPQRLRLM
ncbi:MBL fold metallo-hydrolase [Rubidibacter lacunae]|nr:MBL fold metallo-hydrolase [Rubidibacter lacunae]